jgi:DNA polymerase-3 subunit delta'
MPNIVFHPLTQIAVQQYLTAPAHALILYGATGIGKQTVAESICAQLLDITPQSLNSYPHYTIIHPESDSSISIDVIREVTKSTILKIPGNKPVSRVILICDAHKLTTEAQNALLKLLEEPPVGTILMLTVSDVNKLLPTIISRAQTLSVLLPPTTETTRALKSEGFTAADIDKAMMLSGGYPGLLRVLLTSEDSHPLYEATVSAREILGRKNYDRMLLVDNLSKDKQKIQNTLFIIGQMARMTLSKQSLSVAEANRWRHILKSSYSATEQLRHNAQPKLVLTNLMLEL